MKAEYRKHRREPTNRTELRSFQCERAIKLKVFRKARKDTCNKFVRSLNSRTPTKKVWDKFKKVNRNYIPRIRTPVRRGKKIIVSSGEIADPYANISRNPHEKCKPGIHRKEKKEEELP